jgi:AhpD family alkylhydroperoxidase
MHARIDHPEVTIPNALKAFQALGNTARQTSLPETTIDLVELRASQINGCSVCVDWHSRALKQAGEPDERIYTVAAWRDAPYFTGAERAALALTEAVTRIADRQDPVPDDVWDEAAAHYDKKQLAALVVAIAAINAFNRGNVATRQVSGDWVDQFIRPHPPTTEQAA